MKELTVINLNGQLAVDSREVADMVDIRHDNLLAKIKGYVEILDSSNLRSHNFFIESTYINSQNKEQPCYLLTKKGCDMVANKMTGEKGVVFTAEYVTKFENMEKALKEQRQLSPMEQLKLQYQVLEQHEEKLNTIETKVNHLENNMVIEHGQEVTLKKEVDIRVKKVCYGNESPAYLDKTLRAKVYRALWKDYKGYFNIVSYHDTLKKDLDNALTLIRTWAPSGGLLREIQTSNNQMVI